MGARTKVFTADFMKQFDKEHQAAFGKNAADMGYPDTGCGRYSKKLAYQDWYAMNNGQRAQMNSLEQLTLVVLLPLVAGIVYPLPAMVLQCSYIVGRFLFGFAYTSKGPNARLYGIAFMYLSVLAMLVMTCLSLYAMI